MSMHPYIDGKTTLLVSTLAGLISGYLAYRRGKNPILWFFVGLLFGFFGLFAFMLSTPAKKRRSKKTLPKPVLQPEPTLVGPSDKFWYYLDPTHTQVGPMSYHGITNAWKRGTLPVTALVWHEDLTEWKPLQELIGEKKAIQ